MIAVLAALSVAGLLVRSVRSDAGDRGVPAVTAGTPATPAAGSPQGPRAAPARGTGAVPPPVPPPAVAYRRLAPVAVGDAAELAAGVTATVTQVTPVDLQGQGPGTTAGPGVDVLVEVRNGSTTPLDLLGLAVTASYGAGTPAVPVPVASGPALRGAVDPGTSASGHYAFRLPRDDIGSLVLEVTSSGAENVITVRTG